MVDYKLLRKKLDEKRFDEITEEEQAVLNEMFADILDAMKPILDEITIVYTELVKIVEKLF